MDVKNPTITTESTIPKQPSQEVIKPVDAPPTEALGARIQRQNKSVARHLKDPANESARLEHQTRKNPLPKQGASHYDKIDYTHYIADRLDGLHVETKQAYEDTSKEYVPEEQEVRGLELTDLYRAYKHTPHSPASVFLKYVVHRVNNVDKYEDPNSAVKLDSEFLKLHKTGGASDKNGHLVPDDLHRWMKLHPNMPEKLLKHKSNLHAELNRGVGLNIKNINNEPHIALTRGLQSDIMDHEHSLSSWADLVDTGFGNHMHHAWVPLKDLWYSYQHGPGEAGGSAGHENEYLISHTGDRFEAKPEDIKRARGYGASIFHDNVTDEELASSIGTTNMSALDHPNAGPKTLNAAAKRLGSGIGNRIIGSKFATREQALDSGLPESAKNPNLTTEDLNSKTLQMSASGTLNHGIDHIINHPKATSDTIKNLVSQVNDENVLFKIANSPLASSDVLGKVLDKKIGDYPTTKAILRNPNHTSEHADSIAEYHHANYANYNVFNHGKYSSKFVKKICGDDGEVTFYLAGNKDLDEEATGIVADYAIKDDSYLALRNMARMGIKEVTPLSEKNQLKLLKPHSEWHETAKILAANKGLASSTIGALAFHPNKEVRNTLYLNKSVNPEDLIKLWPAGEGKMASPAEYLANSTKAAIDDPLYVLAINIRNRSEYEARKAATHLIKPWPKGLAKSETNWWPIRFKEWVSSRSKEVIGYYYRTPTLKQAQLIVEDRIIPVEPTDEILVGYVVMAQPAKDYNYHSWEKDNTAGEALIYFETKEVAPTHFDNRVYWINPVRTTDVRIAGIRPTNTELKKYTFNGEKDLDLDHKKSNTVTHKEQEVSMDTLKFSGAGLEDGEHTTALVQLGHNAHYDRVLAAACFLARKRFDIEKFNQGLAVYGNEERAALHSVDLSDSKANLLALAAVITLQQGKEKALAKSEEHISIRSIRPGNEDAIDVSGAIDRAAKTNNIIALKLRGKHSEGAMACRDPKNGQVWLLKPPGGKQSPAAGARDGSVGQARREACFWHIADKIHLGGVIPRADLIILNDQEWSAIKLLGNDWKSLDEKNKESHNGSLILTPYLVSGQIHRWSCLEFVLGSTDSHGQNLLVNNGGSVALIDHGASFAGPRFNPAFDSKSFIPFYLRVFSGDTDFKVKKPEDRFNMMPRLSKSKDDVLKSWLLDFKPDMLEHQLRKYGMDNIIVDACLERLDKLREVALNGSINLSEYTNGLWAGIECLNSNVS